MKPAQEEKSATTTESLAAIVSHPLRRRIWDAITEHPISPSELAEQLKEPVNDVAYHTRKLRDLGMIEPAGTRPVRGATQHFYRAVKRPHFSNDEVDSLTPDQVAADATHILQREFADAATSLETGKMVVRPEHCLFRYPVTLDDEGWQEFAAIFAETVDRLYEAEARCVERRAQNGVENESVSVVAHLNLFERG
jgi:DNA-binding transcriptional ArsR family regulator